MIAFTCIWSHLVKGIHVIQTIVCSSNQWKKKNRISFRKCDRRNWIELNRENKLIEQDGYHNCFFRNCIKSVVFFFRKEKCALTKSIIDNNCVRMYEWFMLFHLTKLCYFIVFILSESKWNMTKETTKVKRILWIMIFWLDAFRLMSSFFFIFLKHNNTYVAGLSLWRIRNFNFNFYAFDNNYHLHLKK